MISAGVLPCRKEEKCNEHNDRNSETVSAVSLCPLCPYRRCSDSPLLLFARCHPCPETLLLYRGRPVPCGIRGHGGSCRPEPERQHAFCPACYGTLCHTAAAYRSEYQNKGRRRDCHDFRRGAGYRLSADEPVFNLVQFIRRRVQYPVRLHLHPDSDKNGGLALRRFIRDRGNHLYPFL